MIPLFTKVDISAVCTGCIAIVFFKLHTLILVINESNIPIKVTIWQFNIENSNFYRKDVIS